MGEKGAKDGVAKDRGRGGGSREEEGDGGGEEVELRVEGDEAGGEEGRVVVVAG